MFAAFVGLDEDYAVSVARSSNDVCFFGFPTDMNVRLSKRVLDHIVARHPEVKAYTREIAEAVRNPDLIVRGLRGELKALRFYSMLHIGSKYLVVDREFDDEGYYNRLFHF